MRKISDHKPHGVTLGDGKQYARYQHAVGTCRFYEVDIREIIDGERKSEQMNEELKETVIKVTDYTETNNARLLKRVRIIGITGVITILIAMVMDAGGLAVSPFWESVKRDLYAWTLGTLIANILYTTGWLKRISEKKMSAERCG